MTITDDMNRLLKNQQGLARKVEVLSSELEALKRATSIKAPPTPASADTRNAFAAGYISTPMLGPSGEKSRDENGHPVTLSTPCATGFLFGVGLCLATGMFAIIFAAIAAVLRG